MAGAPRVRHKRRYLAQKDGGGLGGLPRLEIEQGGRAGAVASKASGEGGAVPVDESMQGSSGTLGSTGSFGVELRSRWRGQGGRNRAGDVEIHSRNTYRRLERRRGGGHRRGRTTPDRVQRGRGGGVTMWQRRHDYTTARLYAEMEGGGGRPEEWRSSGELGGRRQRVYTPGQRYRVKNLAGTYVGLRYRLYLQPVP